MAERVQTLAGLARLARLLAPRRTALTRPTASRSRASASRVWDFTVPTAIPSTSAVSRSVRSS